MRELLFGARLTLAGGRTGIVRTLITALGVGLGVAALLLAASLPTISAERADRRHARDAVLTERSGPTSVLVGTLRTEFQGEELQGRLLQAEGDRPVFPPGLSRFPAPGELYVTPTLATLLATPDGRRVLAPRLPGRVVGEISAEGLLGPKDLGFYAGVDDLSVGGPVARAERFGTDASATPLDPALVLLIVIALVALLIPVGTVVAAAVRTGGEDRDRRLAALRLVGADQRMARRIAAGEAIVAAVVGVLVGIGFFLVARAFVDGVAFQGLSLFAGDVRPAPLLGVLVVFGVPAAAVVVSLAALRRVVAEPLGVVRNQGSSRRRRLWWRLVLPVIGLAALLPTTAMDEDAVPTLQLALGIIALLVGVAALLPWLVERVVARLGAGAVAWQLAVRRLQLDPGGAARAVSGIAVAVAGAIALQMVFHGAQARFQEDTGANPDRAQLVLIRDAPSVPAEALAQRLRQVDGVRAVTASTEYDGSVYVGPCPALRELAAIRECALGDTFRTAGAPGADPATARGDAASRYADAPVVAEREDPGGAYRDGVFTTRAPATDPISTYAFVRADPAAYEAVRNAAAELDPLITVSQVERIATDSQFTLLRRAMFAGATIVMVLIGFSLLLTALEQLRERRRLLAVLVAFGTRRSTLSWSLLWQSAVPVALGLVVALTTGIGLGAILLAVIDTGIRVAWLDVFAMVAAGAVVVLLITAASLPVLFRTMRPEGLRTE
ncbi:ABC transporter permease [Solirubrobacter taibaiensis]|nr:ABC transporter permease [Solirubrobacter taibaiensis]